jgi:hypothetical protein
MRRRLAGIALLVAGCTGPAAYPASVTVIAYGAPRTTSSYVLVHEPWGSKNAEIAGRQNVEVVERLDGVRLTCTNTRCTGSSASRAVVLEKPEPGVRHVEVLVEKDGFEAQRLTIPFGEVEYGKVIVLMKPVSK